MKIKNEHHPFCNLFGLPREGCKRCDELYKKYPPKKSKSAYENWWYLIEKHFPSSIVKPTRSNTRQGE